MLKMIFTKIKYNYKIYLWLVFGLIFMTGIISMLPMLYSGALNNMLIRSFEEQYEKDGYFPAVLVTSGTADADNFEETANAAVEDLKTKVNIPFVNSQIIYSANGSVYTSDRIGGSNISKPSYVEFGFMNNTKVVKSYDGELGEGNLPCSISQTALEEFGFVLGELVTMETRTDGNGNNLTFRIMNIIEEDGVDDYCWYDGLKSFKSRIYMDKDTFVKVNQMGGAKVYYVSYSMLDYRYINHNNALGLFNRLLSVSKTTPNLKETVTPLLRTYLTTSQRIVVILYIMTIPIYGLTMMFLYMLIQRIVNSEIRDISIMRSRGKRRKAIIGLYLVQGLLLSLSAALPGLGLGYLFGKGLSHITGFLQFGATGDATYRFTPEMFLYMAGAVLVANIMMIIPVIKVSDTTIIQKRNSKYKRSNKPLWEKYFIDVILLVVSVYLLFTHHKQLDSISNEVLVGHGMDPLIFFNASLFIIAICLLFVRITFIILGLIYKLSKNKMGLPLYASITELIRTREKNTFIFVFMTLTIALSIFHSSVARSIDNNKVTRVEYGVGADVVIKEHWKVTQLNKIPPITWKYYEPDYMSVDERNNEFDLEQKTRVINETNAVVKKKPVQLMAINTEEFGQIAHMPDNVTPEHWYNYLNRLAQTFNGVIISRNMAEQMDYKVGDTLSLKRNTPVDDTAVVGDYTLVITDIVDGWPGYQQYNYQTDKGKLVVTENFLAVMNYAYAVKGVDLRPYEVWCKGHTNGNPISAKHFANRILSNEIADLKNGSEIKIKNIVFTLEVVGALILCAVGFTIYWITSVKSRENLFGIYRAMGISSSETNRMIWIEEFVLTFTSIFIGVFSGVLSIYLFTPLFAALYLPEKHAVKLDISFNYSDVLIILAIILIILVVCNIILGNAIRKLKITDAVKLGED